MGEIVLLGAGASVEANIPNAYGMTESILNKLQDYSISTNNNVFERVANFVMGGLLFQKGVKGYNPLESKVDIEEFFNAILLLADRDYTELAPFVGSWHYVIEELDKVQPPPWKSGRFIEEICKSFRWPSRLPSEFQLEISFRAAVEGIIGKPGRGRIFHELSQIMLSMLHNLVWIRSTELIRYLKPLIIKGKNEKLIIATLNYDNTIELASQSEGISCNTFIDNWVDSGVITIQDDNLNLLKLHGSIDWKWQSNDTLSKHSLPYKKIEKLSEDEIHKGNVWPAVIFGRTKLTTEGPFLDFLRFFQKTLWDVNLLTVIGYSFRDDHINNYILDWLNKSDNHFIKIVDPKFEESNVDFVGYLKYIRQQGPERIIVISETTGKALLSLYNK